MIGEGERDAPLPLFEQSETGAAPVAPPSLDTGREPESILVEIPQVDTGRDPETVSSLSDTGRDPESILVERIDTGSEADPGEDSILVAMEDRIESGEETQIKTGRRVHFFPGKRKVKNGQTKKTGIIYWEWYFRDPETGNRRRPYGGTLDKLPAEYRYRLGEYLERSQRIREARDDARGLGSLAESFIRLALSRSEAPDRGEPEG